MNSFFVGILFPFSFVFYNLPLVNFKFMNMLRLNVSKVGVISLVLMLLSFVVVAQDNLRNDIKFKAGTVTELPSQDWSKFDKSSIKTALFDNNYFLLIQFNDIPSEASRSLLKNAGIELLDYIPSNSWTARVSVNANFSVLSQTSARNFYLLDPKFKQDLELMTGSMPERMLLNGGKNYSIQIIPFFDGLLDNAAVAQKLNEFGAEVVSSERTFRTLLITIPAYSYNKLIQQPWVLWIEAPDHQAVTENLPGKTLHRSNVLNDGPRNLTGNGVRMGQWDGGKAGPHLDFLNRIIIRDNVTSDDHHTHVAGTMLGAGLIDPFARGMAPKASLYSYDYNGSVSTEVATSLSTDSIVISQNSWGYGDGFVNCTVKDPYNSESRAQDININNYPYFLHVHSAGNSQAVCVGGWGTTTGKAAKNTLVVANVSAADAINSSSSFGPTQDGRLKPEISGMGVSVYSTLPNNQYVGGYTGTSMATPGISGTMAQLFERFRQLNSNSNPIASLMKAVACNTAKDLGNAGPDYKFGFGRINGLQAVRVLETNRYAVNTVANAATNSINISVPAGVTRLRVMLAWSDPAATANANPALVNDLDLVVKDPSNVSVLPWTLDPANPANVAVRAANHRDVMEQVTIDNPATGNYTLQVSGFSVPSGPSQQYAITWEIESPYIEVNYPNGTEKLVPGASETIQWSSVGVTATQTVQYSTDNGTTWTTLSSAVAAATNQYTWTVPSSVTSQALVRVFSGALTDVSDAVFSIIGTPTLSYAGGCTTGDVSFSWTAVTGANSYDLLKLDTATAAYVVVASAVTGTTYNYSGLNPNATNWFSVRARTNTGVVGQRSMAKEIVASSISALSIVATADSISGCAPFSTILRAVLPATSYTVTSVPVTAYAGAVTDITAWTGTTDDGYAEVTLPFTFKFYNSDYTKVYPATNGYVTFGSGSTAYTPQTIPSTTAPNNVVALAWTDLNLTSGKVRYFTTGVTPNRKFVIEYDTVPPYSGTGSLTGQIIFYETTNIIELVVANCNITAAKTQGVENSGGTAANFVAGRNNAAWTITTPSSYQFVPAAVGTYSWTPATSLNSSTVQYPVVTALANTTTYTVTATVNGCTVSDTVKITLCPTTINLQLTALHQGMQLNGSMPAYLFNMGLSTNPNDCDSVIVELRSATSPHALVSSSTAIMNTAGVSSHTFPGALSGVSYYIVVKHRNSIETWSKLPVLINSGTNSYNFKN
jgi:Subtilase family